MARKVSLPYISQRYILTNRYACVPASLYTYKQTCIQTSIYVYKNICLHGDINIIIINVKTTCVRYETQFILSSVVRQATAVKLLHLFCSEKIKSQWKNVLYYTFTLTYAWCVCYIFIREELSESLKSRCIRYSSIKRFIYIYVVTVIEVVSLVMINVGFILVYIQTFVDSLLHQFR